MPDHEREELVSLIQQVVHSLTLCVADSYAAMKTSTMTRNTILALASLAIWGCSSLPPNIHQADFVGKYDNDCLPVAITMTQGLQKAEIAAKVLLIKTPQWNHAVVVYVYPRGANKMWVYDETWKSLRVRAFFNDPEGIAKAWIKATGRTTEVLKASFLE